MISIWGEGGGGLMQEIMLTKNEKCILKSHMYLKQNQTKQPT